MWKIGYIILGTDEKLTVWKKYIGQLFIDHRVEAYNEYMNNVTGPELTNEGVENTIKEIKTGKATGPNE